MDVGTHFDHILEIIVGDAVSVKPKPESRADHLANGEDGPGYLTSM